MKIKLIRKIKQRIRDISNVWSVAGIRNVYVMAILPHFGSKSTRDIRRERKQQAILHYLQTNYQNLILKYTQKEEIPPASNQAPIWVCWWQGENAMPPIVQSCFQSLCSHAGNHLVHLITQENISKYVTIPDYILRKVQEGKISFTHFSDILRMCLLYEHGGLWIDATVYVSQPIPEKVFQEPLFTVAANIDTDNISQAKWMGFILGSSPQGVLCSFARELFFQYWEKENKLLDYFLIDYVISIAKTPRERIGFRRVKAGDAGQFDRAADTCGKLVLLLDQQACSLGTDGTCAQQSNANRRNIFLCQGILP